MVRRFPVLALLLLFAGALAAAERIPAVFVGEWRATIVAAEGDYAQWYRPGDTTDVAISRLGILRTLDGGGWMIHFLLRPQRRHDHVVGAVAVRPLPWLKLDEQVEIVDDHGVPRITVEVAGHGRMELELEPILPRGRT